MIDGGGRAVPPSTAYAPDRPEAARYAAMRGWIARHLARLAAGQYLSRS